MIKDERSGLYRPKQAVSRREALKMGAFGVGGLALGGSILAACGDDGTAAPTTTAAPATTGAPTTTAAPATTAAPTTTAAPEAMETIKAHWVYIGPENDNGWAQEHHRGRQAAVDALGDRMESSFTPNIFFDASTTQLFQELVDDGNDIIFAITEYAGLMSGVAEASPDTKFCECNGHTYLDNLFPYYVSHEVAAYQLGVAAGHLTDNGRIGYIGAFPTAASFNDVNGLLLGARTVNPEAAVEVVMINSFFDPQLAAQAADALIANGVGFLFGIMGEPTYLQLAEQAGVWTGYWNLDLRSAAPTRYVSNYDLSAWGPFYTEQCQRVLDGTWTSQSHVEMLDCSLGAWGDEVPQHVQDSVADVAAQMASGDLHVYEGPLVDSNGNQQLAEGESLDSVEAFSIDFVVDGVTGI